MKKVTLITLIIFNLSSKGQNHLIGFQSSINFSKVTTDLFNTPTHFRTGMAIGITYDYTFKKYFTIGSDIIYNQLGFSNDIIFIDNLGFPTGYKATIKYNYDYIKLPIRFGFNYGKTFYGFVDIGLTPSFLVNAKTFIPTIVTDYITFPKTSINMTKKVNLFDIGGAINIGGGYKFKERYWLYTSFGFQHSFMTISNNDYYAKSKLIHYNYALSIGFKYRINK